MAVFDALSSRNLEATYQRCLALDLIEAGVRVEPEVSIHLMYKGQKVGTRRADLMVKTTRDEALAVIELKAATKLSSENLKQLEYYMSHLKIGTGYLINFPHDKGFPEIEHDMQGKVFQQTVLLGRDQILSDMTKRGGTKTSKTTPEIIKVTCMHPTLDVTPLPATATNAATAPCTRRTFGITLKDEPCKKCIKEDRFCDFHKNQEPPHDT
jgi:GxxExxY protein